MFGLNVNVEPLKKEAQRIMETIKKQIEEVEAHKDKKKQIMYI